MIEQSFWDLLTVTGFSVSVLPANTISYNNYKIYYNEIVPLTAILASGLRLVCTWFFALLRKCSLNFLMTKQV